MIEILSTLWGDIIGCIFAIIAGVAVFKITQEKTKRDDRTLRNVLVKSKREKVTVDWISDRIGWNEDKILEVAAAHPKQFRTGVVQPSGRSFVALK